MRASVRYCGQTIMKSPSLRASARDCGQLLLLGHGAMGRKLHLQSNYHHAKLPCTGLAQRGVARCGRRLRLRTAATIANALPVIAGWQRECVCVCVGG